MRNLRLIKLTITYNLHFDWRFNVVRNGSLAVHVRLQEELLSANEISERLEADNTNIDGRINDLAQKMQQFGNIDALKSETELKRQVLQ